MHIYIYIYSTYYMYICIYADIYMLRQVMQKEAHNRQVLALLTFFFLFLFCCFLFRSDAKGRSESTDARLLERPGLFIINRYISIFWYTDTQAHGHTDTHTHTHTRTHTHTHVYIVYIYSTLLCKRKLRIDRCSSAGKTRYLKR